MKILVDPGIAYLLIVTGIILLLITFNDLKFSWPKIGGLVLCLLAGGAEFVALHGNPWAFLVVALSPLPYFIVMRQERLRSPLFLVTILMLTLGSFFLFRDENGIPVHYGLVAFVSTSCGVWIWLTLQRRRTEQGAYRGSNQDSLVGMIGEVWIEIEPFSTGSVRIDGEIWRARSQEPIMAGSRVRVVRQDGITLTVKKVENIPRNKK